jgi:hypothetical protein
VAPNAAASGLAAETSGSSADAMDATATHSALIETSVTRIGYCAASIPAFYLFAAAST